MILRFEFLRDQDRNRSESKAFPPESGDSLNSQPSVHVLDYRYVCYVHTAVRFWNPNHAPSPVVSRTGRHT